MRRLFSRIFIILNVFIIFIYLNPANTDNTVLASSERTVLEYQGEISKKMVHTNEKWVNFPNSDYGNYPSTYDFNSDGYKGTLKAKRIKLVPSNKKNQIVTNRSKYFSDSWTSGWVNGSGDVSQPYSLSGSYYDSPSGKNVNYTLNKSGGGLSKVDTRTTWSYYTSYGRSINYDKNNNLYLGFMSNNSTSYYAGRWSDSRPGEAPDTYYGDPFVLGFYDWNLVDYGWDESKVVNADSWASISSTNRSKLVYSGGSYWWRSEGGTLNKYRRGVWIKYNLKINQARYKQNYSKTVGLPDYIDYQYADKWKVYVEYEGQLDSPPEHVSHAVNDARYVNGNDYWVQPNDSVRIDIQGFGIDNDIRDTMIRLSGSGQDEIASHIYTTGLIDNWNHYNSDHVKATSSSTSYYSTDRKYKQATFNVKSLTSGHAYDIFVRHIDHASTATDYIDSDLNLKVDGEAPTREEESITGAKYIDGDTYWTRTDDTLIIKSRQRDTGSGNRFQYLRALDSEGIVSRSKHDFGYGTTSHDRQIVNSGFSIIYANRSENTDYGNISWTAIPRVHGSIYTVQSYFQDYVDNNSGYQTIGTVKVDDKPPKQTEFDISGYTYKNGNDYWIHSNDSVTITQKQEDISSGNRFQYLRFKDGDNIIARSRHDFDSGETTNIKQVLNDNLLNIQSANRIVNNDVGTVKWNVTAIGHGNSYNIEHYYQDNVGNNTGYNSDGYLKVDDVAPIVAFRNNEDTDNFVSRDWDNETLKVRLKFNDVDSGYNKSRYAWTQLKNTPSENSPAWSSWKTSANYVTTKAEAGEWYLHVQAEDNVGNRKTISNGLYKYNTPPEVTMTYEPDPVYEGDTVDICVEPSDADDHLMNVVLKIRKNGGDYEIVIEKSDVKTGDKLCYDFVADYPSYYEFEVSVDDDIDTTTVDNGFMPIGLGITGEVLHTEEWDELHIRLGTEDPVNEFYSGETFVLKGDISDHPEANESVTVNFKGIQDNGGAPVADISLLRNNTKLFSGEYTDLSYQQTGTALKDGSTATFLFEVKYSNGHIETDTVNINIIGDVYDVFQVHRRY